MTHSLSLRVATKRPDSERFSAVHPGVPCVPNIFITILLVDPWLNQGAVKVKQYAYNMLEIAHNSLHSKNGYPRYRGIYFEK